MCTIKVYQKETHLVFSCVFVHVNQFSLWYIERTLARNHHKVLHTGHLLEKDVRYIITNKLWNSIETLTNID